MIFAERTITATLIYKHIVTAGDEQLRSFTAAIKHFVKFGGVIPFGAFKPIWGESNNGNLL